MPCDPEDFTADDIRAALASFGPGSAGGISGLMVAHLQLPEGPGSLRLWRALATCASLFAWDTLPREVNRVMAGSRLIAIPKKTPGEARPIAVGNVVRRIAGKCLIRRLQVQAAADLWPHQLGVGRLAGPKSLYTA